MCYGFLAQLRGHETGINYVDTQTPDMLTGGDYHYKSILSSPLLIVDQSINSQTAVQSTQ